jgi:hypothetical protein
MSGNPRRHTAMSLLLLVAGILLLAQGTKKNPLLWAALKKDGGETHQLSGKNAVSSPGGRSGPFTSSARLNGGSYSGTRHDIQIKCNLPGQ